MLTVKKAYTSEQRAEHNRISNSKKIACKPATLASVSYDKPVNNEQPTYSDKALQALNTGACRFNDALRIARANIKAANNMRLSEELHCKVLDCIMQSFADRTYNL